MIKSISIILILAGVCLVEFSSAGFFSSQGKRGPCPGCQNEISKNDEMMRKSLQLVLSKQNAALRNIKVISATKQTVVGYKYRINFEADAPGGRKTCDTTFVVSAGVEPKLKSVDRFECN
uniref:Venom cystatin 4 n=1 Tax=Oncocephalus sp. TaxID=2944721 RepID=A0AB38ZEP2_9HEMI